MTRLITALLLFSSTLPALADSAAPAVVNSIGKLRNPHADTSCVDVEVNGQRTPSFDCLSQQMSPEHNKAAGRNNPALSAESAIQRGPNHMGLITPGTVQNRMGNTYGKSAFPQRPERPNYPSLVPSK